MARSLVALGGVAAAALLLFAGVPGPADAHSHSHGGGGYSGRSYMGSMGSHSYAMRSYGNFAYVHPGHAHFHRRVFVGVPFAYGAYPYYYDDGGGCYWLRRRAAVTGSPYWWSRYEACLGGYYDY